MARILIVSPTPTHPPTAGNRIRILGMADALRAQGHALHFLHIGRDPADAAAMRAYWGADHTAVKYRWPRPRPEEGEPRGARLRRRLRAWLDGDTFSPHNWPLDAWYTAGIDDAIDALRAKRHFDAVIVEYVFFSRALLRFGPETLKIVDTHDRFADRYRRFLDAGQPPVFFSCSPGDEARGLDRADAVLAIQEEERAAIAARCRRARVITVGHAAPVAALARDPDPDTILFVGSANSINVDAAEFFLREVLPRVRAARPGARLLLAGSVCGKLPDDPACEKLGVLDDLADAYGRAAVVVNPRRLGTGLSIKSIEALACGRPLVATPAGATGIGDAAGDAFLLAETAGGLADAVLRLLGDPVYGGALVARGREYARRHNAASLAALGALLDAAGNPGAPR